MNIQSAKFIKGVVGDNDILEDEKPHIAFIGRSNAGKSSVINTLTGVKDLARTSSFPGRTQEINFFLINKKTYFVDLPGYGYARLSREGRERVQALIGWYLFDIPAEQKYVILIVDANVGMTDLDLEMFEALMESGKNVVIVANKVDKLKSSEYIKKINSIQNLVGDTPVFPFSSVKQVGRKELLSLL